ncbi:MAG: hypothetical protein Tsb0021_01650 [Chlamydiales bacterium]
MISGACLLDSLANKISSKLPDQYADLVYGTLSSVTVSCTVSLILTGGNPMAAVGSAGMALLSQSIYFVSVNTLKKFAGIISRYTNRPVPPLDQSIKSTFLLFSWGTSVYLGNSSGLTLNNKASFFITILSVFFGHLDKNRPVFGTVAV